MKIKNFEIFPDNITNIINKQELIGIRLSGGIDSATLCYIVLKYFPHMKLLPITLYNVLRPAARQSVDNVLQFLKSEFPDNKIIGHEIGTFDTTGYVKSEINDGIKRHPKDVFQRDFIPSLFKKYQGKLNFILSGETLNPPISEQEKLFLGTQNEFLKERNDKKKFLLSIYGRNLDKFEYSPFRNFNKKEVAEICQELNLVDKLLPITETCETAPSHYDGYYAKKFDITYTQPGVEPCQHCWPCMEKYWAYGVFDFNTPHRTK